MEIDWGTAHNYRREQFGRPAGLPRPVPQDPMPAGVVETKLAEFWRVVGRPRPERKQEHDADGLAERRWSQR